MNKYLKTILKQTGIKMGKYDNEQNKLYHQGKSILLVLDIYMKQVEEANMTSEQFFLDFLDSINEYSIKY